MQSGGNSASRRFVHLKAVDIIVLESGGVRWPDQHAFNCTRTVVRLFGTGVRFVSRTEAKRPMRGLDAFGEVTLDYSGVEEVGQGFIDGALRVSASQHPDTRVTPVGMTGPVEFMVLPGLPVSRTGSAGSEQQPVRDEIAD